MPRKATNRALVVHAAACLEIVLGTEASLVVRFVQANVDPIVVLLVPCFVGIAGALLQEDIGDLVVNVTACSRAAPGR